MCGEGVVSRLRASRLVRADGSLCVDGSRTRYRRVMCPVLCPVELPRPDAPHVSNPFTVRGGPIAERGPSRRWPGASVACLRRDAGGSRTHFDRVAAGCLAVWLQRLSLLSCPRQESNLAFDLRRVACAPTHPEDIFPSTNPRPSPARESNPALRLRRPPCVHHTRKDRSTDAPARNRTWSSTSGGSRALRHTPRALFHRSRNEQGREDLNPIRPGWSRSPLPGGRPCEWEEADLSPPQGARRGLNPRLEIHTLACCRYTTGTITIRASMAQRKGRGSNPQGSSLARLPSGSRRRLSGSPSSINSGAERRGIRTLTPARGCTWASNGARPAVSGYLPSIKQRESGPPGSRTPISCLQDRCPF